MLGSRKEKQWLFPIIERLPSADFPLMENPCFRSGNDYRCWRDTGHCGTAHTLLYHGRKLAIEARKSGLNGTEPALEADVKQGTGNFDYYINQVNAERDITGLILDMALKDVVHTW